MTQFLTRDFIGHRASHCSQQMLDGSVYSYSASVGVTRWSTSRGITTSRLIASRVDDLFLQEVRQYFNDYEFKLGGIRKLWDTLDQASGFTGGHVNRFPTLYP